jgi:hypothetical protein
MAPESIHDTDSLLARGARALYDEGNLHAARWWFDVAYHQAEREGDGPAIAIAALGLAGLWVHEHRTAVTAELCRPGYATRCRWSTRGPRSRCG